MTPTVAITVTIKVRTANALDFDAIDQLAEEIRLEVESAWPDALSVELDDWVATAVEDAGERR